MLQVTFAYFRGVIERSGKTSAHSRARRTHTERAAASGGITREGSARIRHRPAGLVARRPAVEAARGAEPGAAGPVEEEEGWRVDGSSGRGDHTPRDHVYLCV